MKYTEILDHLLNNCVDEKGRNDFINTLTPTRQIAWRTIEFLNGRKGFDNWWDEIRNEDKNELFEGLVESV